LFSFLSLLFFVVLVVFVHASAVGFHHVRDALKGIEQKWVWNISDISL
jgi:hypothetical protein